MEQRISMITLGVADVARSRKFYEGFGWQASGASNPDVAFLQAGGIALGLYGRTALAEDATVSPEGSGFSGVAIAHNVRVRDEVDTILAEAEALGGRVLKAGKDTFWGGYSGYFADPDGHLWEVAWNPFFEITPEGHLRLPP
jgi:predicted lactoylglutathione lyase